MNQSSSDRKPILTGSANSGKPAAQRHRTNVLPAMADAAYLGKLATRKPHTQVKTNTDWRVSKDCPWRVRSVLELEDLRPLRKSGSRRVA